MIPDDDLFESEVRSEGDLAGFFEFDGETGYFYLYDSTKDDGKIVGAIHIFSGPLEIGEGELEVRWDVTERLVGLFIKGQLWAAFDGETGAQYGGGYCAEEQPTVSELVISAFASSGTDLL